MRNSATGQRERLSMDATESPKAFETVARLVQSALQASGPRGALSCLSEHFDANDQLHELFETLKFLARFDSGIPLIKSPGDSAPTADQQADFERRLIGVCRRVGQRFFDLGDVRNGWTYLRPSGDESLAAQRIREIEVDQNNQDDMIEVLIHEAVDPIYGFDLLLEHFGICNSITTYDSVLTSYPRTVRAACAGALTRRFHRELADALGISPATSGSSAADISGWFDKQSTGPTTPPRDTPIMHDTTPSHVCAVDWHHLHSVIRIARQADQDDAIVAAIELCRYGQWIQSCCEETEKSLAGEVDEIFSEFFKDHRRYFEGLQTQLADDARSAAAEDVVNWLTSKMESSGEPMLKSACRDVLVDFLSRIGQSRRAIEVATSAEAADRPTSTQAGWLFEIARTREEFLLLENHFRTENDLLCTTIAQILGGE